MPEVTERRGNSGSAHYCATIPEELVPEIRATKGEVSNKAWGARLGCSHVAISKCRNRHTYKHIP